MAWMKRGGRNANGQFRHEKIGLCGRLIEARKSTGSLKHGEPEADEGMEDEAPNSEVNVSGRARRQRGWWKRRVVETKLNMCMNDFEQDYWTGTEVGQLGGYGFQGAIFGVDGSRKDGKMGSGAVNSRGKRQTNVHKSAERKARVRTGWSWGELCSRTVSSP
jgi:hypothetical protein